LSLPQSPSPEPWLRNTLTDVPAIPRAVLHALELAREDVHKWCLPLSDEQLNASRAGLPPVAFHLRHIAGSLDRLLTYAEGLALNKAQRLQLKEELGAQSTRVALFAAFDAAIERSMQRLRSLASADFEAQRDVGAKNLPATLGGLLVHVADHTLRHVGQAITTAKIVCADK
jgi:uncharacterized damage-inducible protein DinB